MTQLRTQLTQVTALASEDAAAYSRQVSGERPDRAAAQIREAVPALVGVYGGMAAEVGALFYENQRPSRRPARVAPLSIGEALADDLGWALLPVFKPDEFEDPIADLVSRVVGVTQKHSAAGMRDTLTLSASVDPDAGGVQRYARAGACAFCRYLVAMDANVTTETVWHRNCHCVTVPWWADNPLPTDPNIAGWRNAAEASRAELLRLQRETKPPGMRWRNFFKERPDLAVNNRNIARLMRARLGIEH